MAHGLLITDSFVLKDMYSVNFKAYLDLSCTLKNDLESAIQVLELGVQIDVIIVQAQIEAEDTALGIYNFLLARDFEDIPIIILGKTSKIPRGRQQKVIENIYDIKSVIQATAKLLGVTAQDMAQKEVPKYFPIPISIFDHLQTSDYDIYHLSDLTQNGSYVKIIEQGTPLQAKIQKYKREGVSQLFIKADQRLKFTNFFSKSIVQKLTDPKLSPEKRIENTQLGYAFVAEHIEEIESIEDLIEISKQCVSSMNLIIDEQPQIKALLENLFKNQTSYAFKHCQLIAFIAAHIINEIDWGTKEHIEKLSFIAFYHDILLTKEDMIKIMTNQELEENTTLSDIEKELVKTHAYKTSLLIQRIPRAPLGADNIIKQHHGMISGVGFESNRFSNNLSPLAIIFIVAEHFSGLILESEEIIDGRPSYQAFDHTDAINQLYEKFVNSNYRRAIATLHKLKL